MFCAIIILIYNVRRYLKYNDDNKNIEIVSGNGKDLDISPVYDNLDIAKPEDESNTKKNVIIPEEKK